MLGGVRFVSCAKWQSHRQHPPDRQQAVGCGPRVRRSPDTETRRAPGAHGAARVARAVTPRAVSPLQCYMFHMYVGVRAGGGIGDEIEDPAGDEYEIYRIIFDITFFFFVIIILLAIIQGEHRPR